MLAQARRAARLGVSVATVLRRYVLGHTLLEDLLMQEADRDFSGQQEALRRVLRAQASLLDGLLGTIAGEYRDEAERAARSPERRRVERVQRLLAGTTLDTAELGYDLDGWHLGVIATGTSAQGAVRDLAAPLDRRLLSVSHGEQSVWAWLGGRRRLAVTNIERDVAGETAAGLILAIGEPCSRGRGLAPDAPPGSGGAPGRAAQPRATAPDPLRRCRPARSGATR